MGTRQLELEVLRYDPEKDEAPSFQTYSVPCNEDWVILDAINYVKDNLDTTLAYRWSCHMMVCGSCGMMVNGEPALTCKTFIRELPDKVKIEPLENFPIERDLVVVLDDVMEKLQRAQPLGEARQLVESRLIRREHPLYYSLILRPHDIGHIAVMNIYNDDEWHVGLGLHRSFKADAFSADELRDLNRLYPHLSRALRIHKEFHRLRHRQQSIDAALSRVLMGLIILGPDGTALYSNPVADSLLKRHPGLVLNGGRPQAHFAHENRRLQAMLDDLALADPADIDRHDLALGLHHPERDQPLNVVLATLNAPYGEHADMARGNVALYLCDPASRFHFSLDTLHALYDLTPAEARVAMALTNGQTPKQIAESQGVVVDTVRSQLKSLYVKMGVNKQQDVIRVLLSGAVTRPARTVID